MGRTTAKLSFLGAAGNVTGSRYLLETNGFRILVDCGLYQEREYLSRNWAPFKFPPEDVDAVLLTHAHLDHSGLLPKLVRDGFRGIIYCTHATSETAWLLLVDSARIMAEDIRNKQKRHERERRKSPHPLVPLYTPEDAHATLAMFRTLGTGDSVEVGPGIAVKYLEAGHIPGASSLRLEISGGGRTKVLVFSGDIGRWNKPILNDPVPPVDADYLVIESTYGNRIHQDQQGLREQLAKVLGETVRAGGKVLIPSFAVERAHEILYHLSKLVGQADFAGLKVFLDSPMAIRVTEVFSHHPEVMDEEMKRLIKRNASPFDFPGLELTRSVEESKAINEYAGPAVIIAGSGMCTGGRIKHHLARHIGVGKNRILFTGYQARGTLGREILNGAKEVRILGEMKKVKASVAEIGGFSAHADRDELIKWLGSLSRPPDRIFVTHGEEEAAKSLEEDIKRTFGWNASVPAYGDEVILE